jgi:hypothetical protein
MKLAEILWLLKQQERFEITGNVQFVHRVADGLAEQVSHLDPTQVDKWQRLTQRLCQHRLNIEIQLVIDTDTAVVADRAGNVQRWVVAIEKNSITKYITNYFCIE